MSLAPFHSCIKKKNYTRMGLKPEWRLNGDQGQGYFPDEFGFKITWGALDDPWFHPPVPFCPIVRTFFVVWGWHRSSEMLV